MTTRPTIVLEALSVRSRPTGVAGSSVELLRALAARDRGCSFVVAAGADTALAELAARPHWRVIGCRGTEGAAQRAWFIQRGLPPLCREVGADLLHSLQFVAPMRSSCPLVISVHDMAWRDLPGVVETPRRLYYDLVVPAALRRASLLLASSEATGRRIASHFPRTADRVRVTHLGTPTWVRDDIAAIDRPREAGAAPTAPFFLFVGTLEPRKNLPRLLDAYERLLAVTAGAAPDLRLVGPAGWMMAPLEQRLSRPVLRERVTVAGYCDRAELGRLYRSAVALVFPSLIEGFGLPVLEAMAFGLPVLTSNRGALAEVAGDCALLVDPLDVDAIAGGLQRLIEDAGLRERLRRGGEGRALQWDWSRTADLTTAAYAEILATPSPRK